MEVVPSDDDGVGHLGGLYDSGKDSASDRDFTGEGALLVCTSSKPGIPVSLLPISKYHSRGNAGLTDVSSVDGLGRGLETKTDILVPPLGPGVDLLSATDLGVVEDGLLSKVLGGGGVLLHLAWRGGESVKKRQQISFMAPGGSKGLLRGVQRGSRR